MGERDQGGLSIVPCVPSPEANSAYQGPGELQCLRLNPYYWGGGAFLEESWWCVPDSSCSQDTAAVGLQDKDLGYGGPWGTA